MLQRWRKPTIIAITPDSITINSGDKSARVIDVKRRSSWSQALIELENNAASISAKSVRFILSNHYVRYAILPWQSDVYSQQDWQSLAENYMRSLYGNIVENWTISVATQGHGKPLIISSIDHLLLVQLEALAKHYNWAVESIEPALMSVINHFRNKINKNDWLLISEPQHVVLVEILKDVLTGFSVASPPMQQQSSESVKLITRALMVEKKFTPQQIHIFGECELTLDDIITNNLSVTESSDRMMASSMMAGLI